MLGLIDDWERLVELTRPLQWSAQAMHAVTKALASSLNTEKAAIFYERWLLPAVRQDISTNKKLQYHFYEALKHAVLKANAWIKGILFPLC
jgi:essential nuclear protein 1